MHSTQRIPVVSQYWPIPRAEDDGPASLWQKTKSWMRKHNHKGSPLTFLQDLLHNEEDSVNNEQRPKQTQERVILSGDFNATWTASEDQASHGPVIEWATSIGLTASSLDPLQNDNIHTCTRYRAGQLSSRIDHILHLLGQPTLHHLDGLPQPVVDDTLRS